MNYTDRIYQANIKQILNTGFEDVGEVRTVWGDGTPAHTLYVNQMCEHYDISKGEFPLSRARTVAWKSGIKEILAIYQTQTNTQEGFESHGIKWWSPWVGEDGTIGRAYSYNLESHRKNEMEREIVKIKRIVYDEKDCMLLDIKVSDLVEHPQESFERYNYLGKVQNERKYVLQSKKTGEIAAVSKNCFNKIKSNEQGALSKNSPFLFDRIYYGVGYLDNYFQVRNFSEEQLEVLKRKWIAMLKRCYSKDTYCEQYYKNIFVVSRWHSFKNFLEDVRYLPQYHLAAEENFINWELDKDYYGSNAYGPKSCAFLTRDDNILYSKSKPIVITTPGGEKEITINLAKSCLKFGLNYGNSQSALNGSRNHVKNYKFQYLEVAEDEVFRYELSRNQMNELISGLKSNPNGRRHIISFWNWSNIDKKNLVECAFQTLWTVRGKYLDLTLVQRSNDYLVAGHINKIQYVALQMMVAKATGYEVGNFCHFVQNLHIYDRHIEGAKELLTRFNEIDDTQPRLILDTDKTDFYSFTIDDFRVEDYEPISPQIRFELAI